MTWAENAGIHYELDSALTADNIIQVLMAARTLMKNRRVKNGARLTIDLTYIPTIVDSKYFTSIEKIGEKAVVEGSIGKIFGMDVFECESDLMPANVPFMITVKKALLAPKKINDFKIHTDPPGLSGNLLEFRMYHDAFVRGKKSDGALAACAKGSVVNAPTITMTGASAAVASETTGATVFYTLDGSDPRYSSDAKACTAAVALAKGDKLRAYAKKDGMFNSDVVAEDYAG